jgi:hypothetical protein
MSRVLKVGLLVLTLCLAATASASASAPRTGRYQCYATFKDVSPITGEVGYQTNFEDALNLGHLSKGHGRYHLTFNDPSAGHYGYRNGRLSFRGGALNDNSRFWHVAGTFHSHGVLMPHSTLANRNRRFTIVLRDLRADDSDQAPAFKQFDMSRAGGSYWYCGK